MSSGKCHSCIQGKDSWQAWMVFPLTLFNSLPLEGILLFLLGAGGAECFVLWCSYYYYLQGPLFTYCLSITVSTFSPPIPFNISEYHEQVRSRKYMPIPLPSKSSLTSHSIFPWPDRNDHGGDVSWHWPMTLVLKRNILFQLVLHQEEKAVGIHKTKKLLALLKMFSYR